MKKIALLCVLLLLIALFAGCAQQESASEQTLKIGALVSLTGPDSKLGTGMDRAAKLAAEEINAKGGVFIKDLNKRVNITIVSGNDESTAAGGQKAVTELILSDNVDVLVGGYSSAVVPVEEPIVLEHKVPYIITGASSPIVTRRTDMDTSYFLHHCPTTTKYGTYTALFIDEIIRPAINEKFNFSTDRPLRLAVMYQDNAFGLGVLNATKDTIAANNLNIDLVTGLGYARGSTDFHAVLTSIKATNADVLYTAGAPSESPLFIQQARRDLGLNTIIIVTENNEEPEFYSTVGPYGEYSVIESRFSPYTAPKDVAAAHKSYTEAYKAKYGELMGMMATSTYEGVYIAAQAVENAGTLNGPAIRDALENLTMPQVVEAMVDGEISFTKDYHESSFIHFMTQLYWDEQVGEVRPKIIYPAEFHEAEFVLPDWYQPGST
jgi:branched-chain amino acid transport system substrate-binding protein